MKLSVEAKSKVSRPDSASVLMFIGWFIIIAGFIAGIVLGMVEVAVTSRYTTKTVKEFQIAVAIIYWGVSLISGTLLIGAGRIIDLLTVIANKEFIVRDISTESADDKEPNTMNIQCETGEKGEAENPISKVDNHVIDTSVNKNHYDESHPENGFDEGNESQKSIEKKDVDESSPKLAETKDADKCNQKSTETKVVDESSQKLAEINDIDESNSASKPQRWYINEKANTDRKTPVTPQMNLYRK